MLNKTAEAVGKTILVLVRFWDNCPAADKNKAYQCIVVEFHPTYDFGAGFKNAGYLVKEMGESGDGSLELGVASGEQFMIR